MSVLSLNADNIFPKVIRIGYEGENVVTQIDFNLKRWITEYGLGGVTLLVLRHGDANAYPVALMIEDGIASWVITKTDTAKVGRGAIQLKYVVDEKIKKSPIFDISCLNALDDSDTVPDPYDSWLATLTDLSALVTAKAAESLVNADIAQAASQSAQSAETGATAAAQTASSKASEATVSAQSAASSAQTATDKATLATNKAQAASESASLATAKASAAATSETNAAASAQTAIAKASEAAASATSAQEYDESAQASAVNAQTAQGLAETAQTAAETAQGLAEDARDLAQQYAESIDPEHIFSAYPTDTVSEAVASFADGADDIPLKSLVVNIDPVQDTSSGDPSPTNICPISGWTGANVTRCGKNLWDEEWEAGTLTASTGAEVVSSVTMRSKNFIRVKPGMRCIAVGPYNVINTNSFIICYYDKDGVYVGYITLSRPGSFDVPNDGRIALMRFAYRYYLHDSGGIYNSDVSVNYPSTATAYEPYNTDSEFIDISFPTEAGTVYGGSLDVLSGVLTVYPYYASYNGETLTGRWISDRDVYAVGTTPTIGAQVVNIGAEGTEIQLSPTEVKSLLGQNNIFADTGDTAVEYRADPTLYISRKIAEAISALS